MRVLLTVVCLLVSSAVFAQDVESRVILSQLPDRDRDGVVTIPTATIPTLTAQELANLPVLDEVRCRVTMPTATYEDPSTVFVAYLYKFEAPGFWRRLGGATFRGIPGGYTDEDGNHNPPFTMGLTSGGMRGREVQCVIESQTSIRYAAEVEHFTVTRGSR